VLRGLGVGPGRATGRVRILQSPKQGMNLIDGEVLVARMTSPDWAPTLRRAGAIVTDAGGSTCHAAIVSREFGIPGVVGTGNATTMLSTGQLVTVDAASGQVFDGAVTEAAAPVATPTPAVAGIAVDFRAVEPRGAPRAPRDRLDLGQPGRRPDRPRHRCVRRKAAPAGRRPQCVITHV
jgi:pyruvate, water dikinase